MKLEWKNIKISKLISADWNYKEELNPIIEEKMASLKNNIDKNGFIQNIIVRELSNDKFEVINGNHRLIIAQRLNLNELMCCNVGKISKNKAKRIAIETNETNFDANKIRLAELFVDISKDFDDLLDTTSFTEIDVDLFEKIVNPEEFSEDDSKNDSSTMEQADEFRTIKLRLPCDVADQFDEQVKRFKNLLYPDDDAKNVSIIMPIEAMIQALHQIDNNNII